MTAREDDVPTVDEELLRRAGFGHPDDVPPPKPPAPALAPVSRGCRAVIEHITRGFGFP